MAKKGVVARLINVVVRIESERDVVRNPKHAVSSADHSLLIPAVGKSEAGREFLLSRGILFLVVFGGVPTNDASPMHGDPAVPLHPVTVALTRVGLK